MKKFFSFYGRTHLPAYWGVTVLLIVASIFIGYMLAEAFGNPVMEASTKSGFSFSIWSRLKILRKSFELLLGGNPSIALIMVLWIIFSTWTFLAITARRLRDAGLSPWLSLLSLIPILGFVPWLIWGWLPSKNAATPEPNISQEDSRLKKFFSFYGRTRRPAYWGVTLFLRVVMSISGSMLVAALENPSLKDFSFTLLSQLGIAICAFDLFLVENPSKSLIIVLWVIFNAYIYLPITSRRLRDVGWNPWFSLLLLVPHFNFILWFLLGCLASKTIQK